MKSQRTCLILFGLVAAVGVSVFGYSRPSNWGALLIPSQASDRLLSNGVWRFKIQIPAGYDESHFVGMQLRRSQSSKSNTAGDPWVSVERADDILTTAGIGLGSATETGTVAIQIASRGNDPEELIFLGGFQKCGTSSKLKASEDFLIGRLSGTSVLNRPVWHGNELHLLQVVSEAGNTQHVYDVMLEIRDEPICR